MIALGEPVPLDFSERIRYMDYGHRIVTSDSEQVNLNPHEHALMTTPWYAMIFQVLTTAHNGHDLLLGLPISRIIPIQPAI